MVYTLSKCSGGKLNFDGRKNQSKKCKGETLKVQKFSGETRYSMMVVDHISYNYKLDLIS